MPRQDMIVIGGSAGSVAIIGELVKALPKDFNASIFVVVHLRAQGISLLPTMLDNFSHLRAKEAQDQEPIQPGTIYVAPPNRHLLVEPGVIHIFAGPVENGFRPAVDALFRSAARAYGPRVIGVILSGMLDDGTLGLANIKRYGGIAVVQDPQEAEFPEMPRSALEHMQVDYVVAPADLAELLVTLTQEPEEAVLSAEQVLNMSSDQPTPSNNDVDDLRPLIFSCPECGGVLVAQQEGSLVHYTCEVKHIYSPLALFNEQNEALERALWAGLRGLEEKSRLAEQVAQRAQAEGNMDTAGLFLERARISKEQAELVRQLVFGLV